MQKTTNASDYTNFKQKSLKTRHLLLNHSKKKTDIFLNRSPEKKTLETRLRFLNHSGNPEIFLNRSHNGLPNPEKKTLGTRLRFLNHSGNPETFLTANKYDIHDKYHRIQLPPNFCYV